jgi:hypothetical protein
LIRLLSNKLISSSIPLKDLKESCYPVGLAVYVKEHQVDDKLAFFVW